MNSRLNNSMVILISRLIMSHVSPATLFYLVLWNHSVNVSWFQWTDRQTYKKHMKKHECIIVYSAQEKLAWKTSKNAKNAQNSRVTPKISVKTPFGPRISIDWGKTCTNQVNCFLHLTKRQKISYIYRISNEFDLSLTD